MKPTVIERPRSDLMTRSIAGLAMIAVALAALWLGGVAFWLLVSAAAAMVLAEWCGLMRAPRWKSLVALGGLGAVLVAMGPMQFPALAVAGIAAVAVAIATASARIGAGVLYAAVPAVALVFLRGVPDGFVLTAWTLALVWATDIGAYFAGRAIGGPRLAPRISPAKTWAGLAGGTIAALLLSLLFAARTGLPTELVLLAPLLAILAQIGDLFESWLKRRAGVKDSGRLLPGHGGVMDRLDGVVPVAVVVAALVGTGWA